MPLRFTPTAWSKLLLMRDAGPTEIGGFGITASDDLLLVHDLRLVRQTCTSVSVAFDDRAVADMFDEQVDLGRRPEQFARIWIHTHPGSSAVPSALDEATFQDVFGRCDWAVMFILARGGATYARLQFRAGPGAALRLPVGIDWQRPFTGTDERTWQGEYDRCVRPFDQPAGMSLYDDPLEMQRNSFDQELIWDFPFLPENGELGGNSTAID